MHRPPVSAAADLAGRFGAFVVERHPFAARAAVDAFEKSGGAEASTADEIDRIRRAFPRLIAGCQCLEAVAA